jgi:hypothetical protein
MEWIDVGQDRDQWMAVVEHRHEPSGLQNVEKFLSSFTTAGFSRRAQLSGISNVFMLIYKFCIVV